MRLTISNLCKLLLGFVSLGCNTSLSVEETVNIPVSDAPTVMAFLCPQDSVHTVRVRYTTPAIGIISEAKFYADLKKTTVELREGQQSAVLSYDSVQRLFSVRATRFRVEAGKQYSLSVQMPGRPPALASCTIPANTLDLKSIRWGRTGGVDYNGVAEFRFRWPDFAGETNYYAFWRVMTRYDAFSNRFEIRDEQTQFGLTDENLVNGEVIADPVGLLGRADLGGGNYERHEILICNTDQTYYNYHRSLLQLRRDDSPFSEPVRMATNVFGGYGVMAGYTRVKVTFR